MYYYKIFLKNDILNERFQLMMNTVDAKEIEYITRITARRYVYKDFVFVKAFYLQNRKIFCV